MNKFIDWLMISSANPNKTALTVKGFLIGIIPIFMLLFNFMGIQIGEEQIKETIDGIELLIILVFGIMSLVMTGWGLIRKIYFTFFK